MSHLEEPITQPAPVGGIYTAQDLEQLPSNERYELIRGELCAMPNNSADHGNKTMRLSAPVALFVEDNDLGECFAAETRFIIDRRRPVRTWIRRRTQIAWSDSLSWRRC